MKGQTEKLIREKTELQSKDSDKGGGKASKGRRERVQAEREASDLNTEKECIPALFVKKASCHPGQKK